MKRRTEGPKGKGDEPGSEVIPALRASRTRAFLLEGRKSVGRTRESGKVRRELTMPDQSNASIRS